MTGSTRVVDNLKLNKSESYLSQKDVAQKRLIRQFGPRGSDTTSFRTTPVNTRVGRNPEVLQNSFVPAKGYNTYDHFSMSLTSNPSPSSSSCATNSPRCSTPSSMDTTSHTSHPEFTLKIVLIGDSGVGKSNLVMRFAKNRYEPKKQQTVGFEFATKTIRVGERRMRAQIWDTAGQERFQSLNATYYRNAVGAMIVYDITNRSSFENVTSWLAQVHEHSHESLVMILVGNKCDLAHLSNSRQVSTLEAARFAAKHSMEFTETSALDATNVMDAFKKIIVPVGRLLSPTANSSCITQLPPGWRRVLSRTRYV